jgi:hypothetical protein
MWRIKSSSHFIISSFPFVVASFSLKTDAEKIQLQLEASGGSNKLHYYSYISHSRVSKFNKQKYR